ncbi:unnamed protein product [Gadus morhua 'NCC']|jgi:hypothetical protein
MGANITDHMTMGYAVEGGTRRRPAAVVYTSLDLNGIIAHVHHNQRTGQKYRYFTAERGMILAQKAAEQKADHSHGLRPAHCLEWTILSFRDVPVSGRKKYREHNY